MNISAFKHGKNNHGGGFMTPRSSVKYITLFLVLLGCSAMSIATVTSGNSSEMNAATPQPGGSQGPQPSGSSSASPSQANAPAAQQAGGSAAFPSQANPSAGQQAGGSTASSSSGNITPQAAKAPGKSKEVESKVGGDTGIVSNIQANVATHSELNNANVTVNSKNGIVSLIGNVTDENKASEYIEIAASTKGVKAVDSAKLTVNNEQIDPDSIITANVKGSFIRNQLSLNKNIPKPIKVQTKEGIVTLTGTVTDKKIANKAIQLAKAVNGVTKVKSEIIIIENKK